MLPRLRSLIRSLRHRDRFEADLAAELEFHLESYAADLIRAGTDPDQARRLARQRFGSSARVEEEVRRASGLRLADEAGRNLRVALRSARRSPLFTVTVVLTLGLCLGAGLAVFAVTDAVLWRPLPYPEPDRLALVIETSPTGQFTTGRFSHDGRTWERLRAGCGPIPCAAFSDWVRGVNLVGDSLTAHVRQQRVSAGFFDVLRVAPARGREFTPEEDRPGGDRVVILSHGLWSHTFMADPGILGRSIQLKGEPHTVIGVMPEGFVSSSPADLWTPLHPSTSGEGSGTNYQFVARIPAGMSAAEAATRLGGIALDPPVSAEAPERGQLALEPLKRALSADLRRPLLILFAAVLMMLMVGCINLAALQLARSVSRRTEIATRLALGGGAGAIVRQLLGESAVLALGGGAAGLIIGIAGMRGLSLLAGAHFGIWQAVRFDARALAAALLLTLLATLLFGLAPACHAGRIDLRSALTAGGGRHVLGSGHRLRRFFLLAEVALVVTLLFSAGLLLRSYAYMEGLEPGFDARNVVAVTVSLDDARYGSGESITRLIAESVPRLRAVPGVVDAGMGLSLPYTRALNMPFRLPGVTPENEVELTNLLYITPGYLSTLGIPRLAGRLFGTADRADTEPVVIVNRAFAVMYLTGEGTPAGALERVVDLSGAERRIVGVAGDVQQLNAGWGQDDPIWAVPTVYMPATQMTGDFLRIIHTWFEPSWVVRTAGPAAGLEGAIRDAIAAVDPALPIAHLGPLSETVNASLARPGFQAAFLAVVAAFALLLAAVGLWGMVANEVVERSPEMGVRMALGATPGAAVRAAALPGLRLTAAGLVVGGTLSALVAGALESLISGIAPLDPLTLGGVIAVLGAVALLASVMPALRLAHLDPAATLRRE